MQQADKGSSGELDGFFNASSGFVYRAFWPSSTFAYADVIFRLFIHCEFSRLFAKKSRRYEGDNRAYRVKGGDWILYHDC